MGFQDSVLTASITIIIGVTVYAVSQILSNFIIEPIHKQDEIRGEIADVLDFYANIYCNPGTGTDEEMKEASNVLRQKATLLRSRTYLIRWYGFFSWLKIVPTMHNVTEASGRLIGLSNAVTHGDAVRNYQWAEDVKDFLKLRERTVAYSKIGRVLHLIPFLSFLDCVSTIIALTFGAKEASLLPAFFITNWGSAGLIVYSILFFIVLQLVSEYLILEPMRSPKKQHYRLSLFLLIFLITIYYSACSVWLQIVTMNFLYPIDLGGWRIVLSFIIIALSGLSLFLYTNDEIQGLIKAHKR